MFGWLARRRANRRRQIFRYFDGSTWRQCDPIETLLKLQSHPKYDYRIHPQMVDDGDREAIEITCDAIRVAFGVRPFDAATGSGITVSETLELLAEFCVYLEALKKSTEPPAILPSPTEPMPNGSDATTTSDTSDCGSTDTVPSCDTPIESGVP